MENEGVAFVLDLTERKLADKALRESEERFRTLMQFSFDVYWETDAQHRFVRQDFSERVTDGPLPGSELGKTRWEVPYMDIDEEAWHKHRETLDAHLPFRDLEYARPTPDGGKRYAAVSGLPMLDEAGTLHRLSRRRAAYHRAQTNRGSTAPAGEGTSRNRRDHSRNDGHDCGRWAGRIYWQAVSEYSGLSEKDGRGSGWMVTVHPDDLDHYLSEWRTPLVTGDPVEFETRVRRADGAYRWFSLGPLPCETRLATS